MSSDTSHVTSMEMETDQEVKTESLACTEGTM